MKITAVLYSIVFLVMLVFFFMNIEVIVARGTLALSYGLFVLCTLAMLVRSLVFIYEIIVVDEDRQELKFRLLRKVFPSPRNLLTYIGKSRCFSCKKHLLLHNPSLTFLLKSIMIVHKSIGT